jgi:peptidyl-prolyl cis-trans isomerase SurA
MRNKFTLMMRTMFFALFILLSYHTMGQSGDNPVLLKIDDKEITRLEFETIYKKNNRDSAITEADLEEYLDLFINFKLKVMEAEKLGRDTLDQFKRELAGYRDQLARPYLVDKSITDSLVREAYTRMKTEIRASHILIKLPADPTPEDTLTAYKKIMGIKAKVQGNPGAFEEMARQMSEDPSAKSNGGDLGYFSSLQMVYPFESLVYNTEVGEVGGPVRTQFGYHIVKVADKREARGQVRVAHIMIRADKDDPEEMAQNLKSRIDDIYQRLNDGESFADLARKFSDDRSSASKGGELPVFGPGKMVAEFEEAAYAIEIPGDFTAPIRSPYGWHIIKLIEKIQIGSYEEMEPDLVKRISRDSRSEITKETFIARLKAEYNFSENRKNLKPFYTEVDTSYFSANWSPSEKLKSMDKVLFSLADQTFTQGDFAMHMFKRMRPSTKRPPIQVLVDELYAEYVNNSVLQYEDSQLENKYPEFRALITEYRDGILLFDLTDEKVWSKAVKDSAGLAAFYDANKSKFMWKERAGFDIYTVEDEESGKRVIKMLKKNKNQDEIREALNRDTQLKVRVQSGLKERDEVSVLSKVAWEAGISDVVNDDGQLKVVHIKEIRAPQPKDFSEARGMITAAYQTHLENSWIETLREEHIIEVNKQVLFSIQ